MIPVWLPQFGLGVLMGFIGVGLPTLRILNTIDGEYRRVALIQALSTLNMYTLMYFVAHKEWGWMFGNLVGAVASSTIIAFNRRKK